MLPETLQAQCPPVSPLPWVPVSQVELDSHVSYITCTVVCSRSYQIRQNLRAVLAVCISSSHALSSDQKRFYLPRRLHPCSC